MFKLCQINLNNYKDAQNLLMQNIKELDIDMCAITEPAWIPYGPEWFSSGDCKSLIYIIPEHNCLINSEKYFVAAKGASFTFVSSYRSPNVTIAEFLRLLDALSKLIIKTRKLIVTGDFNAHAKQWGATNTDRRGNLLTNWTATMDLRLANVGSEPTRIRPQGLFIVDLTWITSDLLTRVTNWKVRNDLESLSDHLYISFQVSINNVAK